MNRSVAAGTLRCRVALHLLAATGWIHQKDGNMLTLDTVQQSLLSVVIPQLAELVQWRKDGSDSSRTDLPWSPLNATNSSQGGGWGDTGGSQGGPFAAMSRMNGGNAPPPPPPGSSASDRLSGRRGG